METDDPIRVLIVDDSRIFREAIQIALEKNRNVQVVGSVFSGEKALEVIDKIPVDLVTLDVEMPGIGGLETLRAIQQRNRQCRTPRVIDTLLVSSLTQAGARVTVEGLQWGAFDFVTKPHGLDQEANQEWLQKLLAEKLNLLRLRRKPKGTTGAHRKSPEEWSSVPVSRPKSPSNTMSGTDRAIAIGTSTGGPEALRFLLPQLAQQTDVPIFVVQHILDGLSYYLAESLSKQCGRTVWEASDGMRVQAGGIYLAKSGKHMILRKTENSLQVATSDSPPERGCRPSVDTFLRSAAMHYQNALVVAILTGMGDDGAEGIRAVKRAGGYVLAQDEASCVVWGMPRAAVETGNVDRVLGLDRMADGILQRFDGSQR